MDTGGAEGAEGGEALVRAAMVGDAGEVGRLLAAGVPAGYVSGRGDSGMTALMWAAAEGHGEIGRLLVERGADVNARNRAGLSALIYCLENMPASKRPRLPPRGFPAEGRMGPPQMAAISPRSSAHLGLAKQLLVRGADVTAANEYGESAAALAAKKGRTDLLRLVLDRGGAAIDLEARSRGYGHTAVHLAALEDHGDAIRELARRGADLNPRNVLGWTPLIWAAARANLEALQALLEAGADPNVKARKTGRSGDLSTTTALEEGRKSSRPQTVSRLLIRAGAVE